MRRLIMRMVAVGWWKVPEEKSPNSLLQPSLLQMQTETWVKGRSAFLHSFLRLLFDLLVSSYLSLAPTDAVVGTTHPVAAGLWYLAMGLAEVKASSLEA